MLYTVVINRRVNVMKQPVHAGFSTKKNLFSIAMWFIRESLTRGSPIKANRCESAGRKAIHLSPEVPDMVGRLPKWQPNKLRLHTRVVHVEHFVILVA